MPKIGIHKNVPPYLLVSMLKNNFMMFPPRDEENIDKLKLGKDMNMKGRIWSLCSATLIPQSPA